MPAIVDLPTIGKHANERRLAWVQRDPETRDSSCGVMAIDKMLVDHAGQRSVIAHDDVIANDVRASGAHSPSAGRRFQKQEACEAGACNNHAMWGLALVDDALGRTMPGDVTFDSSLPHAKMLTRIHRRQCAAGGKRRSWDCSTRKRLPTVDHPVRSVHRSGPQAWARQILTPIGEACRVGKGEVLAQEVDWMVDKLANDRYDHYDHWSIPLMKAVLART
jgi:hypothetical protein